MSSKENYIKAVTGAGYVYESEEEVARDLVLIVEQREYFTIVGYMNDDDEMYLVSKFYKRNMLHSGSFQALPDFQGSLLECLTYISER